MTQHPSAQFLGFFGKNEKESNWPNTFYISMDGSGAYHLFLNKTIEGDFTCVSRGEQARDLAEYVRERGMNWSDVYLELNSMDRSFAEEFRICFSNN